jgi:hypothetical protein
MNSKLLTLNNYPINGCADLGLILDISKCKELRAHIDINRPVAENIFYPTPEEFRKTGRRVNYSPGRADHNFLLNTDIDLDFIENNSLFVSAMTSLCGEDYEIMKKSIIRSVPSKFLPEWIQHELRDVGRPNLNPYIYDEFQDIQYFLYTDFHQDKTRPESDFVTVYIYLDDVGPEDSALQVLRGSHEFGMTSYPHSLRRSMSDKNLWCYSGHDGNHMTTDCVRVVAGAGSIFSFHCLTLHGTGFNDNKNPRISLRYLVKKSSVLPRTCLQDFANKRVFGPLSIYPNRYDIDSNGVFLRTGSSLHSYD